MYNKELGEILGVSPSMASRIRAGKRLPGTAVLLILCDRFEIPHADALAAHTEGPDAFGQLLSEYLPGHREGPEVTTTDEVAA